MIEQFFFYLFAAILIFAATMVITARNPVHAALFLVLAFFNSAALWIIAGAEFLGIVLVLVYVGAVMVLFLFVVMMLDINLAQLREGFIRHLSIGLPVSLLIVVQMVLVVGSGAVGPEMLPEASIPIPDPEVTGNTTILGGALYTVYVYPFELAAVILLLAIIASIMLTLRRREGVKHQDVAEQVNVRKGDRLRMARFPGESETGRDENDNPDR